MGKRAPVEHGHVKFQVVAHQRPAADEMHQALQGLVNGATAVKENTSATKASTTKTAVTKTAATTTKKATAAKKSTTSS